MKTLLTILIVLLLLPVGGEARRGKRETIVVRDYSPAHLDWYVAETVQDFVAVMPKRGPRLRYVDMRGAPCPQDRARGITICAGDIAPHTGMVRFPLPRALILGRTGFAPRPKGSGSNLICHELMHALTGVEDNYGALPEESCVWGYLPEPGPFDVDLLRQRHGRKHR